MKNIMQCNVCGDESIAFQRGRVLRKYEVQYFVCGSCGFVQTEAPYWLEEAYLNPIAESDIGLIGRNIKFASMAAVLIHAFFSTKAKYLDYGGGNGMFVRMMRDRGFDFYWTDRFTRNQFARGFEAENDSRFELLTAFEVFEHMINPVMEVERLLSYSGNVLFSTLLIPRSRPSLDDWWYYSPETGQHVSFYSQAALKRLADRFNLNLYSNGRMVHILTKRRLPALIFLLLSTPRIAGLLAPLLLLGRRSLLDDDYFRITGKRLR